MRVERAAVAVAVAVAAMAVAGCAAGGTAEEPVPAARGHAGSSTPPAAAEPAPTGPPLRPLRAGERAVTIGLPGGSYTPAPPEGGADDYRCLLVDPGLTEDAFLTGVAYRPGQAAAVHHSILYRVEPERVAEATAKDAAEDGPGWTCFGGPELGGPADQLASSAWLSAWAPGGKEQVFARGFGVAMPAGTRIVLQIHYNVPAADPAPDTTTVRLRLAGGDADLRRLETVLLPAPVELPCAPGETGPLCDRRAALGDLERRVGIGGPQRVAGLHLLCDGGFATYTPGDTQSCDRPVTEPATVYAAAGHMHLLGRSITIDVDPGTPQQRRLLDVPVYDFDAQGSRPLAEPVRIEPGDVLRVTCTHDVTLREKLPALAGLEPRYVTWGEGTADEMCLGILTVVRG